MPDAVWKKRRRVMLCFCASESLVLLHARFELALLRRLLRRHELVARYRLRRDGRAEHVLLGVQHLLELLLAHDDGHGFLLSVTVGRGDPGPLCARGFLVEAAS
jgi:hypothetical protein